MTTAKTVRRGGLSATDNGSYAERGSARWIQLAVNRHPEVILKSLRRSGAVSRSTTIKWTSPLREEDFKESKDTSALDKAGITSLPKGPLSDFWPKGALAGTPLAEGPTVFPFLLKPRPTFQR